VFFDRTDAPVRVPILSAFKERGTTAVLGKVELGTLERGTVNQHLRLLVNLNVSAVFSGVGSDARQYSGGSDIGVLRRRAVEGRRARRERQSIAERRLRRSHCSRCASLLFDIGLMNL
jgi:hypothetical protein